MSALTSPGRELETRIQRIIRETSAGSARSRQRTIGPSEIGVGCDRQLTYKLLDMDEPRTDADPWFAIVGTAVHAWLADAFLAENARLGRDRYLVEQRVWLTDAIGGTCDLYDSDDDRVIDHKVLGKTTMDKIRKGVIPQNYRVQLHLYALGWLRQGYTPKTVTLAAYPRNDWLDAIFTWSEPFDAQIAVDAMDRLAHWTSVAYVLELDTHPERWALIPHHPNDNCIWCPFYRPGMPVSDVGCPGGK